MSTRSAAAFGANRSGALPTTSRVGSSGTAVPGSSDGTSVTSADSALTKPWFAMIVPSTTPASIVTSNVIVATLVAAGAASARSAPGVGFSGASISTPDASGAVPDGPSGTALPFSRVLPAT